MTFRAMAASAALALGISVMGGVAFASPDGGQERHGRGPDSGLSQAAVDAAGAAAAVRAAGYGAIARVEWEHGGWRVRAADGQGAPVRLRVDPASGAVSRQDR